MKANLKSVLFRVALLVPFISIPAYAIGGFLYIIMRALFVISCLIMIAYSIRNKASKRDVVIGLFATSMFVVPLILAIKNGYNGEAMNGLKTILGVFSLAIFIPTSLKRQHRETLLSIIIVYGFFCILNTISFFTHYPSMDPSQKFFYLLGVDNSSIYEVEVFAVAALYYCVVYGIQKKILIILMLFILLGYLRVMSGNGIVFTSILILLILFYKRIKIALIKPLMVIYAIITVVMVFGASSSLISPVLETLGKSSTISGRTIIWEKAQYQVSKSPIIGNGLEPYEVSKSKIGINRTHNLPLQLLYSGGILMIGIALLIMYRIIKKVLKNKFLKDSQKTLLLMGIIILLFISIMDFYLYRFTNAIILLLPYCEAKNYKDKANEEK